MKTDQSSTLFGASPIPDRLASSAQLRYIQGLLVQCHKLEIPKDKWQSVVEPTQKTFSNAMNGKIQISMSEAGFYISSLKKIVDEAKKASL